jgi:hypothetical protein
MLPPASGYEGIFVEKTTSTKYRSLRRMSGTVKYGFLKSTKRLHNSLNIYSEISYSIVFPQTTNLT